MSTAITQISCSDDYSAGATTTYLFGSAGGFAQVAAQPAFCEVGYGGQGMTFWTQEFKVPVGVVSLVPGVIAVRFRNYVAGQIAVVSAVLFSRSEPTISLDPGGLS